MPRRREPGRVSPRRQRRDDRKPQALMDIVVGAVHRLGAQMGVSVTDIERCAVAEGDLPARAGARSILRLGLNRAVETGRLQRMPGGLFRLPGDAAEKDEKPGRAAILAADAGMEGLEVEDGVEQTASEDDLEPELEAALERAAASVCGSAMEVAEEAMEDNMHVIDLTRGVGLQEEQPGSPARPRPYEKVDSIDKPLEKTNSRPKRRRQTPSGERKPQRRSDADHGRAAAGALFKLAADVISVISQTASARLNSFSAESESGDSKPKSGTTKESEGDNPMDVVAETQGVVDATGTALSAIAVAAATGSVRVVEVSSSRSVLAGEDSGGASATKDAIFHAFKAAAMDIVRSARAFGEALGGTAVVDQSSRPASDRSSDDYCDGGDPFEPFPASLGQPDIAAIFPRPEPDMEEFLRGLLQDVRELAQRVGNCIDN